MNRPTSILLSLFLASLSAAQVASPASPSAAQVASPASPTGPPSAIVTSTPADPTALPAEPADPFDCDTDASTNCLLPDVTDAGIYDDNVTATATTVEVLTFTGSSATAVVTATATLWSDGSINGYYPDNTTDSALLDEILGEQGLDNPYINLNSTGIDGDDSDFLYPADGNFTDGTDYYNDTEPIVYTFTETTTASNPNGGKPINVVTTVTSTIDLMAEISAEASCTGTNVDECLAAAATAVPAEETPAAPQVTSGPIGGGPIAAGASGGKKRGLKGGLRKRKGMQRVRKVVQY